jgi:ABC-type transport system involved in multi-copper enzyme maturation permease subunit
MLWKIAGFEFRFQLFSPASIAIFAIFFLLTFGGVTIDQIQVGGGGAVNINSPNALTTNVLIFSLFGAIIPTVFLSSGVLRDFGFKTSELFYSRPVREFDFVLGRFIGGFAISALVFASVPLAFLTGSLMPWLDPELIGPTTLWWYPYVYAAFGLVNLWVIGTILFSVANFTRSMIATYAAFVGLLVLYFVGVGLSQTQPDLRETFALIDPFGFNTFSEVTRYWTVFDQNERVVEFEGVFLQNRLIWIAFGLVLLGINVAAFRFRQGGLKIGKRKGAAADAGNASAISEIDLPRVMPRLGGGAAFSQFLSRLSFEFKGVVLNVAFWILLVLGLLNTVPGFFLGNEFYGTPNYPVTRIMIDVINGAFAWLPFVVVIYYAAEVMWRERRVGFSYIVDATPTPSWVFIATKFLALCLVIVSLIGVALVAGGLSQMAQGFAAVEWGQYALRGLIDMIVPAAIFAALAIFAQVLMNNRWLGMAFMLVFLIVSIVMSQIGLDHNLYQYGTAPGAPYSDMNRYGHFLGISLWFYAYWSFWALLLLVLSYRLWSRGSLTPVLKRVGAFGRGLGPATAGLLVVAIAGATATGGWIFYNTNIRNEYLSSNAFRALQAEYEREYIHLQETDQPTIVDTSYEVDIYPSERRYTARGRYVLENKTDVPIGTLWVSYGYGTTVLSQEAEGAQPGETDERFLTYAFDFDTPMQPGETRTFDFSVERANPGFRNSGNVTTANYNGTFFNNGESMAIVGFNDGWRLTDRQQRRREGLEPIDRAFPLEDENHWDENGLSNADFVGFRTIVSTSPDQIAIAPGYLEREWEENGRRYFEYVMDRPILNFYSWLSAEYAVAERERDGILLQVFYHPDHAWNVERMLEASEESLAYFSEHLSPFQYRQFRILEFPAYQTFAQSFPNTIPYSEGIGFIADLSDPQDIDYVYYVTAHEAAHQWWAHQVMSANVQGGTMLVETFAQYSALMVMRQEYGEDHMRRFLKYELDRYLSGRGSEAIEEQPLYRVENQQYIHYRKGAVIMYALQDYLGEEVVNRAMQRLIALRGFSSEPYATTLDFLSILREEAGPEWETVIHDFFERIVLFDLEVTSATASRREDGRWDLALEIEAHKFSADGAGEQTEEAIDYLIDIGVFTEDLDDAYEGTDHVLYMDKHRIDENTMRIELIVEDEPLYAGIDPYNKLIDRDSDDNLMRVTIGE